MPLDAANAPLALTPGEPAGTGAEIALKAWADARSTLPPFFLLEEPERMSRLAESLGIGTPVIEIETPNAAREAFHEGLPVLPMAFAAPPEPGRLDPANGPAVIGAIERAVELIRAGDASGVVTLPIHKSVLYEAGFRHPGHTEFLAALAGPDVTPVMMLAAPELRVVPITIHIPLKQVPELLTTEMIVEKSRITAEALRRDFGCPRPRLALAGLNPHAGENATIGTEDRDVVAPAVAALRAEGIDAVGPLSADTMFHAEARATYDAAICMYHDQALIPIKTVNFWGGVNVTLGLPFIRTSPDHGTALELAGTGKAHASSLIAALRMAGDMAAARAGSS
ncbi:4-hydroxythreonine-4-phosphate dehydrogenase PdxA [Nisaea acidiphila]|uniref:4-hydroxythreonine-4-phosphate dehydrogenase n=1 Tax=Nisaea acidiphila TaxID=1862145 RepID=A0A9J7AUD0_9PROT|nr:4-hydroxythreonine-4-phosphate dehydrogenase PdxA [Nisaea acidiphila]UUX50952.1 4-hydroxythreonine-4-phosphate dehydrogenase PdxA [Nisaea acidiphila]